jgi:hypothetical protein
LPVFFKTQLPVATRHILPSGQACSRHPTATFLGGDAFLVVLAGFAGDAAFLVVLAGVAFLAVLALPLAELLDDFPEDEAVPDSTVTFLGGDFLGLTVFAGVAFFAVLAGAPYFFNLYCLKSFICPRTHSSLKKTTLLIPFAK